MAINDDLKKINSEVDKQINAQLTISEKSGADYNKDLHTLLKTTLKMTGSTTTKSMENKLRALENVGVTREVLDEFATIQKEFGGKDIIDYPSLLKLCIDNNLFFGHSSLFSGEITPEAMEEAKNFSFLKANRILHTAMRINNQSVVDWKYTTMVGYELIIVAPITMFNLGDSQKKIIISNREIIENVVGTKYIRKRICPDMDPILLLPFMLKDGKIYFIVITKWGV